MVARLRCGNMDERNKYHEREAEEKNCKTLEHLTGQEREMEIPELLDEDGEERTVNCIIIEELRKRKDGNKRKCSI